MNLQLLKPKFLEIAHEELYNKLLENDLYQHIKTSNLLLSTQNLQDDIFSKIYHQDNLKMVKYYNAAFTIEKETLAEVIQEIINFSVNSLYNRIHRLYNKLQTDLIIPNYTSNNSIVKYDKNFSLGIYSINNELVYELPIAIIIKGDKYETN